MLLVGTRQAPEQNRHRWYSRPFRGRVGRHLCTRLPPKGISDDCRGFLVSTFALPRSRMPLMPPGLRWGTLQRSCILAAPLHKTVSRRSASAVAVSPSLSRPHAGHNTMAASRELNGCTYLMYVRPSLLSIPSLMYSDPPYHSWPHCTSAHRHPTIHAHAPSFFLS